MKIIRNLIAVSILLFGPPVMAATILQVDTTYLANKSELVFEAEVVNSSSEQLPNGYIYTYVDFLLLDILIGDADVGTIITLRFTGGTVGELTLDVGSTIPVMGERGIYFIEGKDNNLTNPILGWSQGHFKISSDGKLIAANNQVVIEVKSEEYKSQTISDGVARGVITASQDELQEETTNIGNGKPILIEQFKEFIKGLKR
jgi:hypothetical protein